MKLSKLPLAIAGAALLPATSFAAKDVSYTYIEGHYVIQNIDFFEEDNDFNNYLEEVDNGDGFGVKGSFAFNDSIFIYGKYSKTNADFTFVSDSGVVVPQDEDIATMKAGVGFAKRVNRDLDFITRVAYVDLDYGEVSLGADDNEINEFDDIDNAFRDNFDDSSDGFEVDAGLRGQVLHWLEASGGVRYTRLNTGDNVSLFGSALFEFNQNFGVNVGMDLGDKLSTYHVGLRFSM